MLTVEGLFTEYPNEHGEVVKATDEDELVAKVEAHVASDHPELVGKLSRDDVMGMAVEDD